MAVTVGCARREGAASVEAALERVRPAAAENAVTLASGLRWLRRRVSSVHAALVAAVTLVPALAGCQPTLGALGERLGVCDVLMSLRVLATEHLVAMKKLRGNHAGE